MISKENSAMNKLGLKLNYIRSIVPEHLLLQIHIDRFEMRDFSLYTTSTLLSLTYNDFKIHIFTIFRVAICHPSLVSL